MTPRAQQNPCGLCLIDLLCWELVLSSVAAEGPREKSLEILLSHWGRQMREGYFGPWGRAELLSSAVSPGHRALATVWTLLPSLPIPANTEDVTLEQSGWMVTTSEGWQQTTIPKYTMSTGDKAPLFHVNHRRMERTGWQGHHHSCPTAGATTVIHVDLHHRMRGCSVYQRASREQGEQEEQGDHIRP